LQSGDPQEMKAGFPSHNMPLVQPAYHPNTAPFMAQLNNGVQFTTNIMTPHLNDSEQIMTPYLNNSEQLGSPVHNQMMSPNVYSAFQAQNTMRSISNNRFGYPAQNLLLSNVYQPIGLPSVMNQTQTPVQNDTLKENGGFDFRLPDQQVQMISHSNQDVLMKYHIHPLKQSAFMDNYYACRSKRRESGFLSLEEYINSHCKKLAKFQISEYDVLSTELNELKEKYRTLEFLYQQQSAELEWIKLNGHKKTE
jgi:hypothetical protein